MLHPLYELLIDKFLEKAHIPRDGNAIHDELKKKYPNCSLPNPRTFQRFLDAETHNPRESVLGYMSAYVLEISAKELEDAQSKNKFKNFYDSFLDDPYAEIKTASANSLYVIMKEKVINVTQKITSPENKILVLLYVVTMIAVILFVCVIIISLKNK